MTPTNFFTAGYRFTGTWDDYFILVVLGICSVLGILLFRERSRHEPMVHSPPMAWLRAGIYFCFVLTFSWVTGVFKVVVSTPLATPEQLTDPKWIGFLILNLAVIVWAYVYWWPRGTITHGRKLYLVPSIVYGLTWGLCAGLLFLSIYSILEVFQWPRLVNALVLVGLVGIYNMNYQLGWWDIHVSPPHNLRATNNGKVAFAHQPFLIASLSFLLIYGNVGIYVMLNSLALCCSAVALRFPPFWEKDGPQVSMDTAIGE
jgi:xanthosine utilization system XapX-like protein